MEKEIQELIKKWGYSVKAAEHMALAMGSLGNVSDKLLWEEKAQTKRDCISDLKALLKG